MSLLNLLREPDQRTVLAHANDHDTFSSYELSIAAMVGRFTHKHGRSPTVLCLGAGGLGQLAQYCLRSGAHHVTVCDPRQSVLKMCAEQLTSVDDSKVNLVQKSSLQLPASEVYDVLVHDLFGPELNSLSAVGYTHDLLRRGVVRSFARDDGTDGAMYHVMPCEGSMTVRMYHVPALSVDARMSSSPEECGGPLPKKPKIIHDSTLPCFTLTEDSCTAVSNRAEVLTEVYDALEDAVVFPTHVELLPTRSDVPADECIIIFEWSAALLDDPETLSIGNMVGLDAQSTPRVRRARSISWGHEVFRLTDVSNSVSPVALTVAYKASGGVSLTVTPSMPASIGTKTLTPAKMKALADATYTKVAGK